jgi:hypothetical protein
MARMWAENWDMKMAETKAARMACCLVETSDETTAVQWGMTLVACWAASLVVSMVAQLAAKLVGGLVYY